MGATTLLGDIGIDFRLSSDVGAPAQQSDIYHFRLPHLSDQSLVVDGVL
jgi:hypothetical protein